MLKGRGREPRPAASPTPAQVSARATAAQQQAARPHAMPPSPTRLTLRTPVAQRPLPPPAKPEPDYEMVDFPSEQYVNAKLQPPPPPPPRPPTGHPAEAGASCGLCGGLGARVRCTECGRRALCASCDDMYHRHPKRRHHQRQALSQSQLCDERPPLPPKVAPPVPPPRRHKMSASPRPPSADQRSVTIGPHSLLHQSPIAPVNNTNQQHPMPAHLQAKFGTTPAAGHLGSMPYLSSTLPVAPGPQPHTNTMGHMTSAWGRPRTSLPGFNMPPNMLHMAPENWENQESVVQAQSWGRPLRRGASVLELGVGPGAGACGVAGCNGCAGAGWRYGSCASLDHQPWAPAWPPPPPACCTHQPHPHVMHMHAPYTPQPYRRADSRAISRVGSRAGSRAASPAMSVRSRASRRTKHRTPSPPPLPSSDADSESESDSDHRPAASKPPVREPSPEESLGPPPTAPSTSWQCEHCTFVNEPGVRVCAVCCRTPTAAPKIVSGTNNNTNSRSQVNNSRTNHDNPRSIAESARAVADTARSIARLDVNDDASSPSISPARNSSSRSHQNGETKKSRDRKKERISTGCGPSPPREEKSKPPKTNNHLLTPTRGQSVEPTKSRHDMGVGPSPPRENNSRRDAAISPARENLTMRASPFRESVKSETPMRHSISVGPSPPRENTVRTSPAKSVQKKSTGTSPPRALESESSSTSLRANVSNTGTSPPPQSISTQTYEVPTTWERPASRARSRRRFRDDARCERSHSRHSLSSDTRESERSARTSGGGGGGGVGGGAGRWEWREYRDSSPGGEWSGSERRREPRARPALARRASHLDLHHDARDIRQLASKSRAMRTTQASPERTRAMSLEALNGAGTAAAERGLELARLMGEAERLGFSAAEVQAALAQSPGAPLAWLRSRWPGLCAGVRAAAARLEPRAALTDREARAALARHRGAMWPAVTECVDRHRRQAEGPMTNEEGRLRGRVWGSPAGADDEAAPPRDPRLRAEDSSDEYDGPPHPEFRDDDWMHLPLDVNPRSTREIDRVPDRWERPAETDHFRGIWEPPLEYTAYRDVPDPTSQLQRLLTRAGVPALNENLLLQGLLANDAVFRSISEAATVISKPNSLDLIQSENDFIEAYNALTRSTPLPNVDGKVETALATETGFKRDTHVVTENDSLIKNVIDGNDNENIQITNQTTNSVKQNSDNQQETLKNNFQAEIVNSNTIPRYSNQIQPEQSTTQINSSINNIQNILTNGESTDQVMENALQQEILEEITNIVNEESKHENLNETNLLDSPQTSSLTKKEIVVNEGNNSDKSEPIRKGEEKTTNLNDIVDNTQRLIQQMKEEINSDINSIDSRNISQSEADTSSNESDISTEHESSFSESEDDGDTESISSAENESSSAESGERNFSERRPTIVQRTSSEENEQFEEAMDHIEDQIEDFKNKNIELLDSIARSLQEEHIVTIEPNQPTIVNVNKEDNNNNIFMEVNSFEEIYAELNGTPGSTSNVIQNNVSFTNNKVLSEISTNPKFEDVEAHTQKHEILMSKHQVLFIEFIPASQTKVLISENMISKHNAIIGNIEESKPIHNNVENIDMTNRDKVDTAQENHKEIPIIENNLTRSSEDTNHHGTDVDQYHVDQIVNNTENPIEKNFSHQENKDVIEEKIELISDVYEENSQTTQIIRNNIMSSLEHTALKNPNENNGNRSVNNNKSNIPKLIKVVQNNNKPKGDKTNPRVIASKVPVRRASLKQYPAPAPPKSHFGNVQSGHVKQLQTRLFNDKLPKSVVNVTHLEIKPSTSTLHKKKPAPPPPTETKRPSPVKVSPTKEKKNSFFRESCRTEDEWTESDSEDSQVQVIRASEEQARPPSPPPPITVRRVSGQLIDLAKVEIPEGSPERQARMLLASGATETWEQARLAVELVGRGAEPPAALLAALQCADLAAALVYLHQDCELCASRLPEYEMVSMLRCTHRCCRECARLYFTVQITERSIADCVCPYCKVPDLENLPEDAWLEYFAHLDILLKTLLETDVHELFQRKLRDRTLARDPNFRWCMECSSGFFVHPKQKKIRCPECRSVSCAKCRKTWSPNHEGLSCEQYTAWLEDNDPERSVAAVQQHLRENGLDCPRCHFKYSLSRGGCMHFTCTQCKYEFCYGCGKPFMMGARCGLSEYCAKLGLHAHHPRNCLFYLRDKEPHELQTLLQMNNVHYETETPEGNNNRCPIQLQRETPTGLVDGICGSEAPPKYAGLCKNHYLEYLSRVVRARGVDPLPLLDVADLETLVRRAALRPPPRPYGTLEGLYKRALAEVRHLSYRCRPHYVEYLAGRARPLDPIPIMDVAELVAELRRRALPLPERGPWDTDPIYAGMCAEIVKEKIPLD